MRAYAPSSSGHFNVAPPRRPRLDGTLCRYAPSIPAFGPPSKPFLLSRCNPLRKQRPLLSFPSVESGCLPRSLFPLVCVQHPLGHCNAHSVLLFFRPLDDAHDDKAQSKNRMDRGFRGCVRWSTLTLKPPAYIFAAFLSFHSFVVEHFSRVGRM